jgi:hypothetical protein
VGFHSISPKNVNSTRVDNFSVEEVEEEDEDEEEDEEEEDVNGIENIVTKKLHIFSNPASNFVIITGLQSNEKLDFYTVGGQLLFTHKAINETEYITVGHLPKGIFFVKTSNGQTLKWIKK